jgi:hypothetical protein
LAAFGLIFAPLRGPIIRFRSAVFDRVIDPRFAPIFHFNQNELNDDIPSPPDSGLLRMPWKDILLAFRDDRPAVRTSPFTTFSLWDTRETVFAPRSETTARFCRAVVVERDEEFVPFNKSVKPNLCTL